MLTDKGANDTFLYNTGQITSLKDSTWNRKQFYTLTRTDKKGSHVLGRNLACPPCNVGKHSIPNYAKLTKEAVHTLGSSRSSPDNGPTVSTSTSDPSSTSATCVRSSLTSS